MLMIPLQQTVQPLKQTVQDKWQENLLVDVKLQRGVGPP